LEVRHVGSDTLARGLRCGAAAWLGEEDEGWAAGPTLLTLAAIYDGATRTEAAKIGDVGLHIIRDWVRRFNTSLLLLLEALQCFALDLRRWYRAMTLTRIGQHYCRICGRR
jgi:hypothetical protein